MGISSTILLERAYRRVGVKVNNVDAIICAQSPPISPHVPRMRENIASILEIPLDRVNIKSTTHQGLGSIGEGEAISSYAVMTVI
jgi:2-C-methyl-D-erythritol 2,4-cyclodiphosphate synthase